MNGRLVVFEGIYGSGRLIVNLVGRVHEALLKMGREVYEIESPDSGRAQLMGAGELDGSWRYGVFKADFFFELASRAQVCAAVRPELEKGKIVLCKNFTVSSIVHARLNDHDWFREDLYRLESYARSIRFGVRIIPDLTVFLDLPPELARQELDAPLRRQLERYDLHLQRRYFIEELAKLPEEKVKVVESPGDIDPVFSESLSAIEKLLASETPRPRPAGAPS